MNQQIPSLKRFAEWVTDLTDRYRFNPGLQTTVQIVLLQLGLTILSIAVFGWAIEYAEVHTIGSIATHVHEIVAGGTTTPETLPDALTAIRDRTYLYVFAGLILLNLLFGYLIAQFALRPTRQTLSFQKRFIGNVAHEIRTPLAIIKTSTEVALLDPKLPKDMRETMEETIGELNRISETINNLLSFNTLTRPNAMQFAAVDLSRIAQTVVERHQELADTRRVALTSALAPEAYLNGNATALEQIVTNLTKNALTYTPEGSGRVRVQVLKRGNAVVLSVSDTGIGIRQKDLDHIFEPFYRADTSRARGVGTGTSGLGLAIVHEIVRLHHGAITVRSTVGKGTNIRLTFPAVRPAKIALPDAAGDDSGIDLA